MMNTLYPKADDRYDNPKSIPPRQRRLDEADLPDHDWRVRGFEGTHVVRVHPDGTPDVFRVGVDAGLPVVADVPLKGGVVRGYVQHTLSAGGKTARRYLHRIVWDSVMLSPGAHQIDHVDGDGANNRLSNTQPVCPAEHAQITARRRLSRDTPRSGTGRFHVYPTPTGGFHVRMTASGRAHRSPVFRSLAEALAWREQKAMELFGSSPYAGGV